jgi:DNA topoisomerase-2
MDLSTKYQQKTDKQHILDNPDTYIGSVEQIDAPQWIWDDESKKIIEKQINYVPGLYKLFDEGIVNCRDHVIRMQQAIKDNIENSLPVSNIDISISDDGTITMFNDGNGIDVAMHPEYKIWIPELIFGHLRTSTNYNKEEKKIVGGKNGFGFKLVLIWSTFGSIETIDHIRGLKYKQEFKNNLDLIEKPSVTKCKSKPYTKIVFTPDYKRLGVNGLSADVISLFKKRIYDVAAITDKNLKVRCNSELIPIKNFLQYVDLFIGKKEESKRAFEEANERWEYCVALSMNHEFQQVSFVNGIHTLKGGRHVEYILNQITKKLVEYIEKKKKIKVNPNSIKEQIILFVRCDIENPSFDSQTKDYMNTPVSKFGSSANVTDKFIEKIAKMGIMDAACALTEVKESKVAKKTDGSKSKNLRGIPKLVDANWAGTDKSGECILLLCEGDSAKAGIISGLSSSDRNIIGVYPLKGKVMNIRGESAKKINENKEITELKKIMGLESGKEYNSQEDINTNLRYGKILFMTDQDLDGSHIKGLCINLFQCTWSSLCKIHGFIGFMNTPILKAKKLNKEIKFYNDGEFESWKKEMNDDYKTWNIKYYKGLGTSTGKEFKEYFEDKKIVGFRHTGEESDNAIDMVFNKKRADNRKDWLGLYDRELYLDTSHSSINYEDFINKELIHFSKYDCDRSIPNLMDGLKISLRKILYSAFKKNLTSEIKVAQFTGYVSENACYHHGEASLNQAIVGLAQNYVGSNNINLLVPSGQFGTRLQGGKDSASERYIFTYLNKLTRKIFPQSDDPVLTYLLDDGYQVEPKFYYPIIPMVLVNGTKGIGTGFSTEILCYNPTDLITYIKNKLNGLDVDMEFIPYYNGFNGTIEKTQDHKYLFKGKYEKLGTDKIRVTELPVGHWTQDFKELLESLQENTDKNGKKVVPIVKDYDDMSKDTTIDFTISFSKGKLEELENNKLDNDCNGVYRVLKLMSMNSITNMNLFNANDKLVKYNSVKDIIDDYYLIRYKCYEARKQKIMEQLEYQLLILENKKRYIETLLNDEIDLRRKKKNVLVEELFTKGFDKLTDDLEYKYLLKMTMDSVTEENVEKLENEFNKKTEELALTKSKSINQMWLEELNELEKSYIDFKEENNNNEVLTKKTKPVNKIKNKK